MFKRLSRQDNEKFSQQKEDAPVVVEAVIKKDIDYIKETLTDVKQQAVLGVEMSQKNQTFWMTLQGDLKNTQDRQDRLEDIVKNNTEALQDLEKSTHEMATEFREFINQFKGALTAFASLLNYSLKIGMPLGFISLIVFVLKNLGLI